MHGSLLTSVQFVEYDSRAHRLFTLATFCFWVSASSSPLSRPESPSAPFLLASPPKIRVASSQTVDSRLTDNFDEPLSPLMSPHDSNQTSLTTPTSQAKEAVKVDVSCPRPGDDGSMSDDGPVFRATLKALEQKTGNMRAQMKKVLRRAEHAHTTQMEANDALIAFTGALREATSTNANAVQPALEHYFDKIAKEILSYERQNSVNMHKTIIEPINKLYQQDIKQAESKKRDFEEESKDYYAYVSRYLGQRQDSVKAKKLAESDSKYQTKRRHFELKRFDYSSFMQDLHGGRKEQEVLSHLTKFADVQTKSFLGAAKKVETLLPQLDALSNKVQDADKEYQYRRQEREEKRRLLEKSNTPYLEPDQANATTSSTTTAIAINNGNSSVNTGYATYSTGNTSDSDIGRADSTGSQLKPTTTTASSLGQTSAADFSRSPGSLSQATVGSPSQGSKFKGIRDLEERDTSQVNATLRKEGLLWALNRPGGHVDPRSLNKQGWHKYVQQSLNSH